MTYIPDKQFYASVYADDNGRTRVYISPTGFRRGENLHDIEVKALSRSKAKLKIGKLLGLPQTRS